ncbi:MAG: UvrB/UvrC motif-containing protein [Planctomycetes bacterium]|nr:UvrB/UvrC motif-containing protein [Planctomycetota bacterium]
MEDLSPILRAWPYEPGSAVRKIDGLDGRPKLQVRTPLGIEQFEFDGRPDGLRPEGCESWLEHYRRRADAEERLSLSPEECGRLQEEGVLYYQRYLLFYQIGEYALCVRDTARNLALAAFLETYAARDEDRESVAQYRAYILRMNAMARALDLAREGKRIDAREIIERGIREIEDLPEMQNPVFQFEKMRSLRALRETAGDLDKERSVKRATHLRRALEAAVRDEDYERAARIRDALRAIEDGRGGE